MGLDAVVLAAAGLRRLGLDDAIGELLPLDLFPPSPGQGALGIQVRADSTELREILSTVGDKTVDAQVRAERALLAELHGGCSVPVGAYAETEPGGFLSLFAQVTSLDGARRVSGSLSGPVGEPEKLGAALAEKLIDRGALSILEGIRGVSAVAR
ncbi:hydroxymethylbilane synthase [Actinopolymorpha rutila]|uniref:hydroxymethylbilane synthase n=2 Tax=Actinopolymorpha rutila TaxID=446787 RepID=A0A852ZGE5_9ACTN|nr:hydroxymethylbilane synthase [Actinopolymorpha rutila]